MRKKVDLIYASTASRNSPRQYLRVARTNLTACLAELGRFDDKTRSNQRVSARDRG